jgi:hypothetical protein
MKLEKRWAIETEMLLSQSVKKRFNFAVYGMAFGEALSIASEKISGNGKILFDSSSVALAKTLIPSILDVSIFDKKNINLVDPAELLGKAAPLALIFNENANFQQIAGFTEKYIAKNNADISEILGIILYINIIFRLYHYDDFQQAVKKTISLAQNYFKGTKYQSEMVNYAILLDKPANSRPKRSDISGDFQYYLSASIYSCIIRTSFEESLIEAITFLPGSTVIGAMAGAMAGLYYKSDSFSEGWLDDLECGKKLDDLLTRLTKLSRLVSSK